MAAEIRLQRTYGVDPEELWPLIATSEGLSEWLMPNDFSPVPGHAFTFTDTPRPPLYDGIVGARVLAIDPPRRLQISWAGGGVDTVVTFELEPVSGGTTLHLLHEGFAGPRGALARAILGLGWRDLLRRRVPRALAGRT